MIPYPEMTLAQLRAFTAVAECGGFTAAADRLGISQSGISHAISSLEKALQTSLFSRDRKGARLTSFGEEVLPLSRRILHSVEQIHSRASSVQNLQMGTLRIGTVSSAASNLLPKILGRFQRRYPDLELRLLEGTDQEVIEWVQEYVVDLAVTGAMSPEVRRDLITEDEFRLLVPQDHELAPRDAVALRALDGKRFLMSAGGCEPMIQDLLDGASASMSIAFRVRETSALLTMVQEGLGVTIVPELALPEQLPEGICSCSLQPRAFRQLFVATNDTELHSPAVEAFIPLLLEGASDAK